VMASYTSFLAKIHRMHEETVDEETIARTQLESWAVAADGGLAYRREHGSARFYDLHFDDFMADPIGAVKRIYAHFDQELSPEGERCLEKWEAEHPQGKHGKHAYARREFVIPDREIIDRFADYLEFFEMMPS